MQSDSLPKENLDYMNMTNWYLNSVMMEKGKEYQFRIWLAITPSFDFGMREFYVGLKPHSQDIAQAVLSGNFFCLDPWYSNAWHYRKSHTINAASGAGSGYQIKINVHSNSGTDNGADVYLNGKCKADFGDIRFVASDQTTLLPYWIESISGNVAIVWVKILDNLDSSATTIYLYYGNSGASTTSNGGSTFAFFDDFSASPNGWTLSGSSITGGRLVIPSTGYPTLYYAQKSRPAGYDNYRFRFSESFTGDQSRVQGLL
jgi:hypothetical protein